VKAYSETCPHYLVLDDTCYLGRQPERFVCCPPIRDRATVDELGRRLAGGYIHSVGSDHCCYGAEQKAQCEHDVRIMPNGLPGVETRLTVTWNEYVARGLMTPENFVRVMSSNPARVNGLFPRKGTIAPGSDADLVIFDPSETRTVRVNDLHMASDYTPYEGREVTGWPTDVLLRGRVVFTDGELIDPGPIGQYLSAGEITLW
jgi:dihydropyrimidinase